MRGFRHMPSCLCGCQHVEGLPGKLVQDSDTPKLATLGLGYFAFQVPDHAGGSREQVVCYDLEEVAVSHLASGHRDRVTMILAQRAGQSA